MQATDRAPRKPSKLKVRESARWHFNAAVLQAGHGKGGSDLAYFEARVE